MAAHYRGKDGHRLIMAVAMGMVGSRIRVLAGLSVELLAERWRSCAEGDLGGIE